MRKLYGTFLPLSSQRNHLSTEKMSFKKKALSRRRQCFYHAQSGNLCDAFLFLDSCCEHRKNFVDVTYDTVVANFEDRSIFVFVDGDDAVRAGHTSQVLNSTGDSAGNVDLRSNGFTRLAYLMESADPASVNCGTGSTDSATESVCAFLQDARSERFFTIHAAAAGNDDVSVFDLNAFAAHFNEFDETS